MDEFGNESQLYQDTLFHVSTLVDNVPLTPPIKHYLDKGDIMDTSVSEVALGLWAYSYSKHFRDKYNITKSNLEEVSVDDIIRHIEEYYPKPVTATPTVIQQEVKEGVEDLFNSNPELFTIGTQEQYSAYLDTIFPDSKVKDIVYRGGEKKDVKLFQYWTNNKSEAYMYAKANITKGGSITERNPITVIVKNFKTYIDNKYGENTFYSLNLYEGDYVNQISETEYELQLPSWYKKDIKLDDLDESDFNALNTLKSTYDTIKIEDEYDLDKPYIVNNYESIKEDYDKARKQLDKYFNIEDLGQIKTAILNIKNPYTEEIVQEDLQNDRDAYKNGHDGAFLMEGDHFLVKSNTEQIHILGSNNDIQGFKEFVSSNVIPEQRVENINYQLKSVNILSSDKADKVFKKGNKNNWDINKILSELNIPKEQQELIKSFNTINREEIISNLLAYYSYAIEINITKETNQTKGVDWNRRGENENIPYDTNIPEDIYSKEYNEKKKEAIELGIIINKGDREEYFTLNGVEYYHVDMDFYKKTVEFKQLESPTQYYSSLTVPGGTNYIENEIATPAITPSIKGHAQFATDKGIGWFRSDDEFNSTPQTEEEIQAYLQEGSRKLKAGEITQEQWFEIRDLKNIGFKTRRILEVQSDLFQKGRNRKNLVGRNSIPIGNRIEINKEEFEKAKQNGEEIIYPDSVATTYSYLYNGFEYETDFEEKNFFKVKINPEDYNFIKENQFLQLLNKDNNWVTFFVKSIIQDSAKKGYEKVLFPSGDTASKVEGHTTLEEFKKQKEDRIKELEKTNFGLKNKNTQNIPTQLEESFGNYVTNRFKTKEEADSFRKKNNAYHYDILDNINETEINQLKQELERIETEGFGALKGVYNFYENVIKNVLNKQYGKENVIQITDEFGNTWNEIEIESKRDYDPIYFQLASDVINPAIEELDKYLLDFLKNFNVKSEQVEGLKAVLGMDALGVTDVLNKLILYIKNRNEETLPEESAHMLVALMGENHPDIKELMSTITNWSEYNDIKNQYLPVYNDENKVKIEAVGKLIAKALVKNYKINGLDKNKLQKTLDRILKYIKEILDSISFNNIFMYNEFVADHIAINVLSGNKDYIYKIKNLNPNLNAEEEINNNPNAKKIIDMFSSDNVKLTGSLAIAGTENIRRPKGEAIHDIDFKVKSFEVFEKEILPKLPENAVPIHFGWHKKTYSTYAYAIPLEGYKIKVLKRKSGFSNGKVDNYLLYNEKNEKVTPTQQNMMSVDFFVYKDGVKQKDFDFSSKYIPATFIYEGKMSLGGKSNPYFFSRDKDQEDYVLRDPKSFIHFTKHLYYQLPKQIEPTYNPETKSKTALLDEFNKLIEVSEKMGTKYPKDAINKIKSFLQDLNFNLSTVNEILNRRGLNDNPKAVIDFAYNLVAFGDGATVEDFAEEIGHIISLHAPQDKNLDRALEAIKDTQLYKDNYLNYVKTYSKPGLALEMSPERKAALEVLGQFYGKLLTGTLTEKDMQVSKQSFFTRIMNFVKRMINRTDNFNLRTYLERNRDNFFLEPGKEIKSKEIFYSLDNSEKITYSKMTNAIDKMAKSLKSRMSRTYKDETAPLGEYSKRLTTLQTQLNQVYKMKENLAYDSAYADFLKSLYVDTTNVFNFLEKYFNFSKTPASVILKDVKFSTQDKILIGDNVIIENNENAVLFTKYKLLNLKADADLSTLQYSQLSELREFLVFYNNFIDEIKVNNIKNSIVNLDKLADLNNLTGYVLDSLKDIDSALSVLNSKKLPDTIDELIEDTGIDKSIIPEDIMTALKSTDITNDVGMIEYLLGSTRDSSQPILRLINAIVKNIMHIAKRSTLNFANPFLERLNHRIGQSMDWAYEKYKGNFTGYFISKHNYGEYYEEKNRFFKELNAKYEYPEDFNARDNVFSEIITKYDSVSYYKDRITELKLKIFNESNEDLKLKYLDEIANNEVTIEKIEFDYAVYKQYRDESANWFNENTEPLDNIEQIIDELFNDDKITESEKTVWLSNNTLKNDSGDIIAYTNELVRPSDKYLNPDYARLDSSQIADLEYIKQTKKDLDVYLPTKINNLAPQTYQSAMDTLMKTQLPELMSKLKFLGKDIATRKEDDEIGELTGDIVDYQDETRIIKYNPTRYTRRLLEPNNISTDLLSSMIAYAKMVYEFKEKGDRIEQLEFVAQNIKSGQTLDTKKQESESTSGKNVMKQLENYLRVQIMGITYPDVTIPALNINITKLLKNAARFVTAKNLGLNFATQFVDNITSNIWYNIEKTMGDVITRKSSKLGYSKFTQLAQDAVKESKTTIKNNKLSVILRTLGLSDNLHSVFNDLDKNILMRDIGNKVLFAGYRASNFFISGNAALSALYNYRLYNGKWYTEKEFGKIENPTEQFDSLPSAYDNIRIENGVMSIDGMNTNTFNLFTRRLNNLISKIDGKLSEEDKTYAHSTLIGIVTLIHRDWILDGISRRFKKKGVNFDTSAVDEGYWRSTGKFISDFFMDKEKIRNLKTLIENYNELDDSQKEGVRRTMYELLVVVGSIALAIIMNLGDDDDERDLDYLKDTIAYLSTRITMEMTAFYNPFEYVYAVSDVFVISRDFKKIISFTEMFNAKEIESGKWEGWTRSQKYFLQNIPGVNGAISLSNPEASNRFIINNVLGFAGGFDKFSYFSVPLVGSIDEEELLEIEREKR